MEDDLRDGEQRPEYAESSFFPDLRLHENKKPGSRDVQGDRKRRAQQSVEGDRKANTQTIKYDIIYSGNGILIFGMSNWHPEDRKAILIVGGINDSSILEMGKLGMLKGIGLSIYEKLK